MSAQRQQAPPPSLKSGLLSSEQSADVRSWGTKEGLLPASLESASREGRERVNACGNIISVIPHHSLLQMEVQAELGAGLDPRGQGAFLEDTTLGWGHCLQEASGKSSAGKGASLKHKQWARHSGGAATSQPVGSGDTPCSWGLCSLRGRWTVNKTRYVYVGWP